MVLADFKDLNIEQSTFTSYICSDTLCLIDWKTSKKQKANIKWTYDNPLQLVAYLGAYNFDPVYKDMDKV